MDTAIESASLCLAKDGKAVGFVSNPSRADHAGWLQPAIKNLFEEHSFLLKDLDAIAVSAGPGSYTGLRVGMATAKGLCFTLQKPLIFVNTLQMMASGAIREDADLLCPMIDARRMEVFTAIYNKALNELVAPHNCILSGESFSSLLINRIVFFGNGSTKFKQLVFHPNAIFVQLNSTAEQMISLSYKNFQEQQFVDVAYCTPFYGKEFYSPGVELLSTYRC